MTTVEVWTRPIEDIHRDPESVRWHRIGVWEDGEIVEGDLVTFDDESAEEFRRSQTNFSQQAMKPSERSEVIERRVQAGLIHKEDVYEAFGSPEE